MAFLKLVNRTYGRYDEMVDLFTVLFDNLYIDKYSFSDYLRMGGWERLKKEIESIQTQKRDVWLDQDGFIVGLAKEMLEDMLIGKAMKLENHIMNEVFGKGHVLNNIFGRPSTWARRLGFETHIDFMLDYLENFMTKSDYRRFIKAINEYGKN